jgi:predicted nuclease of predicted toxin-antitoxin system
MNFVADESLDAPIILALRKESHDVFSISESSPQIADEAVLKIANEQNRILLTSDKDFGELVFRLQLVSSGIVLLRLPQLTNEEKVSLTLKLVNEFGEKLQASFSVITANKIRIVSL